MNYLKCSCCVSIYALSFGKHKGKTIAEVPDSYLQWLIAETELNWVVLEFLWHRGSHKPEEDPDYVMAQIRASDSMMA